MLRNFVSLNLSHTVQQESFMISENNFLHVALFLSPYSAVSGSSVDTQKSFQAPKTLSLIMWGMP